MHKTKLGRYFGLVCLSVIIAIPAFFTTPANSDTRQWWQPSNPPSPEISVNATGAPVTGPKPYGKVRGYADLHTHLMSNEGFGGGVVCGETFNPNGVQVALQDCRSHQGIPSILENLTNGSPNPLATHETAAWPDFKYWPLAPSFTHQQMYYKWVERSWRGGQRIMVNQLVSNSGLCNIQGLATLPTGGNKYNCNDMDAIRRELKKTYELQAFIDEQYGGPGRGWFRIVKSATQARKVINSGKLAVVLGVETSEPFGCKVFLNIPQCSKADIDRGLDELYGLGVRSMFLCHKYDNALCGIRYDEHTDGIIVNLGQLITTGQWWNPRTCQPGEIPDNTVEGGVLPKELAALFPTAVVPIYGPGPHCNPKGLTELGEYALRGMMKRHMMVELDHMSAKAAQKTLNILEANRYPGALSTHSWMSPKLMNRLYQLGGMAGQISRTATEFQKVWRQARPYLEKYRKGYAIGMDANGFYAQPKAGGANAPGAVQYPFIAPDGRTKMRRQLSGNRRYDVNVDGVAHYGLVPDWIAQMRNISGQKLVNDLLRSSESYLQTWRATERAN